MAYYLVGGSVYDSASYYLGVFIDHNGYEGDFGSKDFIRGDIVEYNPFWSIGLNTEANPITRGHQQVEFGLFDSYRIKITIDGIYKWVGPNPDDFEVIATGGGVENLTELNDVVITDVTDNELLTWNNGTSKWTNQTAAEAGLAVSDHNHAHNSLTGLNDGVDYEHITQTQKDDLHEIYTLEQHDNAYHSTNYKVDFSENTAFNKNFGTLGTEVCVGNDSRLSDSRTPTAHVLSPATGPHTGTLLWSELSKTGSNLTDLVTRQHAGLTDVTLDQHHAQSHDNTYHTTNYKADFSENTAFNKNFGTLGTEVCIGNDSRLSDARTPTAHVLSTTGPHTGTLPWADLNKTGSNLTDLVTRNHNDLLNLNAGDSYEHITQAQKNELHTINPHTFTEIAEPGAPAANKMVIWAEDEHSHTVLKYKEADEHMLVIGQDNYLIGRNTSGAQIAKGKVVYFNGTSTGKHPNFSLAKADALTTMPAIGITVSAVNDDAYTIVLIRGRLTGLNTPWVNGTQLYVSSTEAGAYTNTFPPSPSIDQQIGTVEVNHAVTGVMLVDFKQMQGRNDGTIRQSFNIGDGASGDVTLAFNGDAGNDGSVIWDVSEDEFVFNHDINAPNIVTAGNVDGVDISVLNSSVREQSSTFPANPVEGDRHYDEDDDSEYRFNGEAGKWVEVGVGGGKSSGGFVPAIGFIAMFKGTWLDDSTMPGWWACTAANAGQGVPDLEDKFVRGAATSGGSGGDDDAVVVSHRHNITMRSASGASNIINATAETGGTLYSQYSAYEGVSGTDKNIPVFYELIFIMRVN